VQSCEIKPNRSRLARAAAALACTDQSKDTIVLAAKFAHVLVQRAIILHMRGRNANTIVCSHIYSLSLGPDGMPHLRIFILHDRKNLQQVLLKALQSCNARRAIIHLSGKSSSNRHQHNPILSMNNVH